MVTLVCRRGPRTASAIGRSTDPSRDRRSPAGGNDDAGGLQVPLQRARKTIPRRPWDGGTPDQQATRVQPLAPTSHSRRNQAKLILSMLGTLRAYPIDLAKPG